MLTVGLVLAAGNLPQPGFAAGELPPSFNVFALRSDLAKSPLVAGSIAYLTEAGREGLFTCVGAPAPFPDPLQGLLIPARDPSRHFARIWNGTDGRPEWFGARVNDWQFDCADALEACYTLCPVSHLAQADYFVRRGIVLNRSWRSVIGAGRYATDQGRGTRVVLQGQAAHIHDANIMLVGSYAQPSRDSSNFTQEVHLAQFTLVRDGASAPHASGDLRRYPAGLRASFVARCSFSAISSIESSVGFYFGGTIYTKVDDCIAERLAAGVDVGTDLSTGFYLDGSPEFGLAGGNASLYLNRCLAVGQHAKHVRPAGMVAEGAFVDSFIDQFESARIANGIRVLAKGAPRPTQTIDLHIRNCVVDGCTDTGIDLDLSGVQSASVEIVDPYIYVGDDGGESGIAVHDGGGLVTLTGGQVHGSFAGGSLLLQRTFGVRTQGLKLHEATRPVVLLDSGPAQIEVQISNRVRRTTNFAIEAKNARRTSFRSLMLGAPGTLGGGISLDARSEYCSVDVVAIDPACFGAGATRTLWFGGADASRGPGAAAFAKAANCVIGTLS